MLGQRYRKTFGRRYRTREQQEQPEQQKVLNKKCSYRRGFMDGFTDDAETGNGKQEYVAVALDGNLDIDNARNDDEHHTKHKGDTRVVEEVIAQEDDKYGHDPVAVDALEGDGVRVGRNSRGRFVAAVVGKRGRRRAAALDPQPRRRNGTGGTLGRGGSRAEAPSEHRRAFFLPRVGA